MTEQENNDENVHIRKVRLKNSAIASKAKRNPWIISTILFAIIAVALLVTAFTGGTGGITGGVISEEAAADKLVGYLNTRTNGGVTLVSSEDAGSLYMVLVSYQGDEIPVYITKDGDYFVQGVLPLAEQDTQTTPSSQQQPSADIPKSDEPKVELFVMTHCPYGTQAEKGMIPVFELLGDKIDGSIRFVHYFMHAPEEDETPIQVCIREEQGDKYLAYLKCFLEDGDSDSCLTEAKISKAKLNSCIAGKSEDYYAKDSGLSQGYGVQGSPTLVINGQIISSGRSPDAYLQAICSAFNEAPEECDEQLGSQTPDPGFGYSASGGSDIGQC